MNTQHAITQLQQVTTTSRRWGTIRTLGPAHGAHLFLLEVYPPGTTTHDRRLAALNRVSPAYGAVLGIAVAVLIEDLHRGRSPSSSSRPQPSPRSSPAISPDGYARRFTHSPSRSTFAPPAPPSTATLNSSSTATRDSVNSTPTTHLAADYPPLSTSAAGAKSIGLTSVRIGSLVRRVSDWLIRGQRSMPIRPRRGCACRAPRGGAGCSTTTTPTRGWSLTRFSGHLS